MTNTVPVGNTYDKYSSSNPIERRLMSGFLARLDEALPLRSPQRVLEVGVGEGEVAARVHDRYPDADLVGMDLPDGALAAHWHTRSLSGTFGDIAALPFPDGSFDLVLAIEVLEHVPDPDAALAEVARVAHGLVILSVPREPLWRFANLARGKYWHDLGDTPGHIQHWGRRGFASSVARHLDVISVASPPPWTMVTARARR